MINKGLKYELEPVYLGLGPNIWYPYSVVLFLFLVSCTSSLLSVTCFIYYILQAQTDCTMANNDEPNSVPIATPFQV
jgi:hypothetical protein